MFYAVSEKMGIALIVAVIILTALIFYLLYVNKKIAGKKESEDEE